MPGQQGALQARAAAACPMIGDLAPRAHPDAGIMKLRLERSLGGLVSQPATRQTRRFRWQILPAEHPLLHTFAT